MIKLSWSPSSGSKDVPLPTAPLFLAGLAVLREKANKLYTMRLANLSCADTNLPRLVEALHHSQCVLQELDLCFNHVSDAGLLWLCETLARDNICGIELTHIFIGGNPISEEGLAAASAALKAGRADLVLDARPVLRGAADLAEVGKVAFGEHLIPLPACYGWRSPQVFGDDSPAALAGLQRGDMILAFGPVWRNPGVAPNMGFKSDAERMWDTMAHFKSVGETFAPIVKASVGLPIDIVVARGGVHRRLVLRPAKWAGEGLLGCKVKEALLTKEAEEAKKRHGDLLRGREAR
jgi:hypothetical protein